MPPVCRYRRRCNGCCWLVPTSSKTWIPQGNIHRLNLCHLVHHWTVHGHWGTVTFHALYLTAFDLISLHILSDVQVDVDGRCAWIDLFLLTREHVYSKNSPAPNVRCSKLFWLGEHWLIFSLLYNCLIYNDKGDHYFVDHISNTISLRLKRSLKTKCRASWPAVFADVRAVFFFFLTILVLKGKWSRFED